MTYLKTSSVKLASSLLVTLGFLSAHAQLTCAADLQTNTAAVDAPLGETNSSVQPPVSSTAPPLAPPVKTAVAVQAPASVLFAILARTNQTGWDPVEFTPFRIDGTRLEAMELPSGVAKVEAVEGVNLSLPLSSSYLLPLSEFRCKLIVQKTVKRGNRYITIKAFEFDNSEGAVAGYDMLRKGSTTVIKRGDGSSDDGDSVSFWQDNFLFIVSGTSLDDDESKEVVGLFATNIAKSIVTHAQPPAILSKMPIVDRVRGSEKIVMGPVSAARAISAPEVGVLFSQNVRTAAVADYQVFIPARERMRLLYIDYGNAQSAKLAFDTFVSRLEQLLSPEKGYPQDGRVLFRMNKSYMYCQARPSGKLLLITGAKKNKSAILLAGQVVER